MTQRAGVAVGTSPGSGPLIRSPSSSSTPPLRPRPPCVLSNDPRPAPGTKRDGRGSSGVPGRSRRGQADRALRTLTRQLVRLQPGLGVQPADDKVVGEATGRRAPSSSAAAAHGAGAEPGRAVRSGAEPPHPGARPPSGRPSRRRCRRRCRYRGSGRRPRPWPGPRGRRCRDGAEGYRAAPRRILDAFALRRRCQPRAPRPERAWRRAESAGRAPPRPPPPAAPAQAPSGKGRAPSEKDDVMFLVPPPAATSRAVAAARPAAAWPPAAGIPGDCDSGWEG